MASQKYNILYGLLQSGGRAAGESNSIYNQSCFWRSTRQTMDLRTPCSYLTTDTPAPTLTGPRGRRSWR